MAMIPLLFVSCDIFDGNFGATTKLTARKIILAKPLILMMTSKGMRAVR